MGTTIYDGDLRNWDKTQAESVIVQYNLIKFNDQQNLQSTLELQELGGQLFPTVLSEQT